MTKFNLYGFKIKTNNSVYEPSDDSFLFADTIIKNKDLLDKKTLLEIGCGTGLLSFIASKYSKHVTCVDINEIAVKLSKQNMLDNNIKNLSIQYSNLFENIDAAFDIIIFNTPYLPQEKNETVNNPINYAWDGGKDGRKTIDKFLKDAREHLNHNGLLIFLESSLSSYNKSLDYLEKHGFKAKLISEKKLSFEKLVVIMAAKID